jgi:hypothetical protein
MFAECGRMVMRGKKHGICGMGGANEEDFLKDAACSVNEWYRLLLREAK